MAKQIRKCAVCMLLKFMSIFEWQRFVLEAFDLSKLRAGIQVREMYESLWSVLVADGYSACRPGDGAMDGMGIQQCIPVDGAMDIGTGIRSLLLVCSREPYGHCVGSQIKRRPTSDFMESLQHDINKNMRGILIDWLVEVSLYGFC
jgi:hypothetical protein